MCKNTTLGELIWECNYARGKIWNTELYFRSCHVCGRALDHVYYFGWHKRKNQPFQERGGRVIKKMRKMKGWKLRGMATKTLQNLTKIHLASEKEKEKKEEKGKTPICIILDLDKNERTILTEGNASVSWLMQICSSMENVPVQPASTCRSMVEQEMNYMKS